VSVYSLTHSLTHSLAPLDLLNILISSTTNTAATTSNKDDSIRINLLLNHLVSNELPKRFKPHPKLNPHTGRVLNRPLGGERGLGQDFNDDDDHDEIGGGWKREIGLSGTVFKILTEFTVSLFNNISYPLSLSLSDGTLLSSLVERN